MAVTYGFYNSSGGDRVYNATQFGSLFDGLISDGVFSNYGSSLMVIANTPAAMNVKVGIGRAWFNHTWTYNDADLVVSVGAAHVSYDRIDIIVLEVNETTRTNTIKLVAGTPSASPVQPSLTNTSSVHQYLMAVISIPHGTTAITTLLITNKIGLAGCPFVIGVVTSVTTDALIAQWNAEFDEWFEHIMDELSEEAAGNLQLQIDALPEVNSVDQQHLMGGASKIAGRKGHSDPSYDWDDFGETFYDLNTVPVTMYVGCGKIPIVEPYILEIPYKAPFTSVFTKTPLILLTKLGAVSASSDLSAHSIGTSSFFVQSTAPGTIFSWMAIGPK